MKVPVDPEHITVPAMGVLPCVKVKLDAVSVKQFTFSLKSAVTIVSIATFVAPFAGVGIDTLGGVDVDIAVIDLLILLAAAFMFATSTVLIRLKGPCSLVERYTL